jgi:archaellum component FlaC
MSVALKLYEQLTETADERQRFRLIADAIGRLEDSWPRPSDVARTSDVRESELRLQKEIEGVRKEIEQVRTETEQVRRETAQVRLEVERVRGEIGAVEIRLHQALHRQTVWIIGAVGAVVGLIRLLDYLVQ